MSQLQNEIGEFLENKVLKVLQDWDFEATLERIEGYDIKVIVEGTPVYIDVKSVREWVKDPGSGPYKCRRHGRAVVRKVSHDMIMQKQPAFYVLCPYQLTEDNVVKADVERVIPVQFISVTKERQLIPWKRLYSMPVLKRETLVNYVKNYQYDKSTENTTAEISSA